MSYRRGENCLYGELGLNKTANAEEIKSAYRKLALEHHPDRHPNDESNFHGDKFKRISAAYQVLGDYDRRRKYDNQAGAESEYRNNGSYRRPYTYSGHRDYDWAQAQNPVSAAVWLRRAGWLTLVAVPAAICISVLSGATDRLWDQMNRGKSISRVATDREKRSTKPKAAAHIREW